MHSISEAAISLPPDSLQAWNALIEVLPALRMGEGKKGSTLKVHALPDSHHVMALPNDDWVLMYERIQEAQAKTRRKQGEAQSGVFYTPRFVAHYLTERTLGQVLNTQWQTMQRLDQERQFLDVMRLFQHVQQLTVIDPACGTGVFLVEVLRCFATFYEKALVLPTLQNKGLNLAECLRHSLMHQLFGIDVDALSVMITELRLWQVATAMLSQSDLSGSSGTTCFDWTPLKEIHAGNTLLDDPFPQQRWDFILGNPPYVSEVRKQTGRFQSLREQESPYYQAKMDLCDAFLAWAVEHSTPDGELAYVLPDYWTQRASTRTIRKKLWGTGVIREYWRFEEQSLFQNAPGHHTALLIWQRNQSELKIPESNGIQSPVIRPVLVGTDLSQSATDDQDALHSASLQPMVCMLDSESGKLVMAEPEEIAVLAHLSTGKKLIPVSAIQQGLVLPQGRLKKSQWRQLPTELQATFSPDEGLFLLSNAEIENLNLTEDERPILKPFYMPIGFQAFQGFSEPTPDCWIIYADALFRQSINANPEWFPALKTHLDRISPLNTSAFAPYGLHRPRQPEWFEDGAKIFCPRQVMKPACAVVPYPAYVQEGFNIIRVQDDPAIICALLNSKLGWFWFYNQKRKGHRLQIDKEVLAAFPAPLHWENSYQDKLISLSKQLSIDPNQPKAWHLLNDCVFEVYGLSKAMRHWVNVRYAAIHGGS